MSGASQLRPWYYDFIALEKRAFGQGNAKCFINSASIAANSTLKDFTPFHEVTHAARCARGELLLAESELRAIHPVLNRMGFRFVVSAEPNAAKPPQQLQAVVTPAVVPNVVPAPSKVTSKKAPRPRSGRSSTSRAMLNGDDSPDEQSNDSNDELDIPINGSRRARRVSTTQRKRRRCTGSISSNPLDKTVVTTSKNSASAQRNRKRGGRRRTGDNVWQCTSESDEVGGDVDDGEDEDEDEDSVGRSSNVTTSRRISTASVASESGTDGAAAVTSTAAITGTTDDAARLNRNSTGDGSASNNHVSAVTNDGMDDTDTNVTANSHMHSQVIGTVLDSSDDPILDNSVSNQAQGSTTTPRRSSLTESNGSPSVNRSLEIGEAPITDSTAAVEPTMPANAPPVNRTGIDGSTAIADAATVTGGTAVTGTAVSGGPYLLPVHHRRASRRRRDALRGNWEEACREVMTKVEGHPAAKWFRVPVDPETDGVPDYLDVVKRPMDFQTVRQKLDEAMYFHPFRWQEDIRRVFYNAFKYHPRGNQLWHDVSQLSILFEQLCIEHEGVNPYAVYDNPSSTTTDPASLLGDHSLAISPGSATAANKSKTANRASTGGGDNLSSILGGDLSGDDGGSIVLNRESLKMLLERAASRAVLPAIDGSEAGAAPGSTSADFSNSTGVDRSPGTGAARRRATVGGGVGGDMTECSSASRLLGNLSLSPRYPNRIKTSFQMPKLGIPPPPDPPVAQLPSRLSDRPMNQIQRRTILSKFRDMDVHYRKAALDLVKDELGINTTLSAVDCRYEPCLDVLPVPKQKQLLVYIKMLDQQQKTLIQSGIKSITHAWSPTPDELGMSPQPAAVGGSSEDPLHPPPASPTTQLHHTLHRRSLQDTVITSSRTSTAAVHQHQHFNAAADHNSNSAPRQMHQLTNATNAPNNGVYSVAGGTSVANNYVGPSWSSPMHGLSDTNKASALQRGSSMGVGSTMGVGGEALGVTEVIGGAVRDGCSSSSSSSVSSSSEELTSSEEDSDDEGDSQTVKLNGEATPVTAAEFNNTRDQRGATVPQQSASVSTTQQQHRLASTLNHQAHSMQSTSAAAVQQRCDPWHKQQQYDVVSSSVISSNSTASNAQQLSSSLLISHDLSPTASSSLSQKMQLQSSSTTSQQHHEHLLPDNGNSSMHVQMLMRSNVSSTAGRGKGNEITEESLQVSKCTDDMAATKAAVVHRSQLHTAPSLSSTKQSLLSMSNIRSPPGTNPISSPKGAYDDTPLNFTNAVEQITRANPSVGNVRGYGFLEGERACADASPMHSDAADNNVDSNSNAHVVRSTCSSIPRHQQQLYGVAPASDTPSQGDTSLTVEGTVVDHSAWGEWKGRVIQENFRMSQREREFLPSARERAAERANAEV